MATFRRVCVVSSSTVRLLALACAALSGAALADEQRPPIAVFDLKGISTPPMAAEAASIAMVRGLRELEAFEVMSADDLRSLISIDRQRQLQGVESPALAAGVQVLGVRHQIVGTLTKTEGGFSAELRLLDTQEGKVISQKSTPTVATLEAVGKSLASVVQELVGPLLEAEQGSLLVRTREEGAELQVDGVLRGSTPMPGPLSLPRGRHRLTVKKDGFIARVGEVTIKKGQLTLEDAILVPSPEFVADYNRRNARLRIGAYVGTGLAVAAIVSALAVDRLVAEPRYQNAFLPRQKVLEALSRNPSLDPSSFIDPVSADCASNPAGCRAELSSTASSLGALQAVSWTLVGVGVVAAGAAAYCWFVGEDPKRYVQLVASLLGAGNGPLAFGP